MSGGVTAGMSKRQVRRLLGRPAERTTLGASATSFDAVVGRVPRMETWLYLDVPDTGRMTVVSFLRGRVEQVRESAS